MSSISTGSGKEGEKGSSYPLISISSLALNNEAPSQNTHTRTHTQNFVTLRVRVQSELCSTVIFDLHFNVPNLFHAY